MTCNCSTSWCEFCSNCRSHEHHMTQMDHLEPTFEFGTCDFFIESQRHMNQHTNNFGHWTQPRHECYDCPEFFSVKKDLVDHQMGVHFYCEPCDRYFQNHNCLMMHLSSKLHRPASLTCPFCNKVAGSSTGLVHHLERGACPEASFDQVTLYEAVRRRDPSGSLTNDLFATPYSHTTTYRNPYEVVYECHLCHYPFKTLASLNRHLASLVHGQNLHHCPNDCCGKGFTTLAGVINHLESGVCQSTRSYDVQKITEQILDPGCLIYF